MRLAVLVIVALPLSVAAQPQTPAPGDYMLCVVEETRKIAAETPPLKNIDVLEQAFRSCSKEEARVRKMFAEQPSTADAVERHLNQIKKYVWQAAQNELERVRPKAPRQP